MKLFTNLKLLTGGSTVETEIIVRSHYHKYHGLGMMHTIVLQSDCNFIQDLLSLWVLVAALAPQIKVSCFLLINIIQSLLKLRADLV